jgi:hypothetical protein
LLVGLVKRAIRQKIVQRKALRGMGMIVLQMRIMDRLLHLEDHPVGLPIDQGQEQRV